MKASNTTVGDKQLVEYTEETWRVYKARGFLSSVNKLAMGTLSRGAELHVPARCRPIEGMGMGSIYGRRSGTETGLMLAVL